MMRTTLVLAILIVSLFATRASAQESESQPSPDDPPVVNADILPTVPVDLADGRLRVVGLSVFPPDPTFYPVVNRLMTAWSACASEGEVTVCGSQVVRAEIDPHDNQVSLSVYVDNLTDLPVEACFHDAMRNPPTRGPAEAGPFGYVVALVVAPDGSELEECAEGVLEAATPYLP